MAQSAVFVWEGTDKQGRKTKGEITSANPNIAKAELRKRLAADGLVLKDLQFGAVDVALTPVVMKKSRPGVVLSCLATEDRTDAVLDVLFQETTTLGVRLHEVRRRVLPRRFVPVTIQGGVVRMKIAKVGAGWEKAAPEYEDCKAIAKRTGRPLKTIMEEALLAYRRGLPKNRTVSARGGA